MAGAKFGVADRGGPRAGSPRFSRDAHPAGLLGSLEAVAKQLAARMPLDRVAAVVSDAASSALDAPALVIAVPDEPGRMRLAPPAGSHLRLGDIEIDLGEQRVVIGGAEARLTPSEIRLLLYLAEEPGRPRTRRDILRHLWRTEHVVDERACDVHVSNLRRKIERDPSHPQRLVTVRSVGYALELM